jgi:hypothetical protein
MLRGCIGSSRLGDATLRPGRFHAAMGSKSLVALVASASVVAALLVGAMGCGSAPASTTKTASGA